MVCIYCGKNTHVTNSRLQKQTNKVWRRRQCLSCQAIFSTLEQNVYENTLAVQDRKSHIMPFQRDKLFLSIYDACKHRPTALIDASALTETVISNLLKNQQPNHGLVQKVTIAENVINTLKHFDNAAYVHYSAYHSL